MNKENNIENEASAIKRSSIYKAFPSNLLILGAETIQAPTGPFRFENSWDCKRNNKILLCDSRTHISTTCIGISCILQLIPIQFCIDSV